MGRKNSGTGYFGVSKEKRGWRAYYKRGITIKFLGIFDDSESAAMCADKYQVTHVGLLRCFDSLNFPEMHEAEYKRLQAERIEQVRLKEEMFEQFKMANSIPQDKYGYLLAQHAARVPHQRLADEFGTTVPVVMTTLKRLKEDELRSLGIEIAPPKINAEAIRAEVTLAQRAGESFRSVCARIGFSRTAVKRLMTGSEYLADENEE